MPADTAAQRQRADVARTVNGDCAKVRKYKASTPNIRIIAIIPPPIISLISMMMLMMLMKSMFQSYYLMLISIEIKCGEAVRQPRTNKDSSANDRGAAHAHAYDRHAIVTTIELQYTRALVHLRPPVLHFLSHCLSLTSLLSHIQRMPVG